MKHFIFLLLSALLMARCALNLVTGRNQLSLVPEPELQLMATGQYSSFLLNNKVLNPFSVNEVALFRNM